MSIGWDVGMLPAHEVYRLLTAMVVPRPVALVTTVDASGVVNAAPFSYFNLMGHDPGVVALGIGDKRSGEPKDTARNIRATGEFVVHLVDEALSGAMNVCALDLPAGESEVEAAGLEVAPSAQVRPPRLVAAPFSLECRHVSTVEIGRSRVVLGEVVHLWVRSELVDVEARRVHAERAGVLGRMHGGGTYARTTDLLELPRLSLEAWLRRAGPPER